MSDKDLRPVSVEKKPPGRPATMTSRRWDSKILLSLILGLQSRSNGDLSLRPGNGDDPFSIVNFPLCSWLNSSQEALRIRQPAKYLEPSFQPRHYKATRFHLFAKCNNFLFILKAHCNLTCNLIVRKSPSIPWPDELWLRSMLYSTIDCNRGLHACSILFPVVSHSTGHDSMWRGARREPQSNPATTTMYKSIHST